MPTTISARTAHHIPVAEPSVSAAACDASSHTGRAIGIADGSERSAAASIHRGGRGGVVAASNCAVLPEIAASAWLAIIGIAVGQKTDECPTY